MDNGLEMPLVQNPDGSLWIDINDVREVDAIRDRLNQLGVRVTALVPDPTCGVILDEVEWSDLYPKIVPRNGPDPGVIVQPAEIPEGHTLVLATQRMMGVPRDHQVVTVLRLIRGPAPSGFGRPRVRPARSPGTAH